MLLVIGEELDSVMSTSGFSPRCISNWCSGERYTNEHDQTWVSQAYRGVIQWHEKGNSSMRGAYRYAVIIYG